MIDVERRRHWREASLASIAGLADLEHQRAAWLVPGQRNLHECFVG